MGDIKMLLSLLNELERLPKRVGIIEIGLIIGGFILITLIVKLFADVSTLSSEIKDLQKANKNKEDNKSKD